ncbi:MAG: Crp/Fnr family transcriptional regulator [Nitrospiraceae bacterium]|nr:MAG: Crp/Fnr family transcriptional regulator [Nitrospiraceae bacterium]
MKESRKNSFLKQTEIFSRLNDAELEEIIDKIIVKQFKKNETILYEEDTNEVMYIILMGKVKVIKSTEDGKEIIMAMHKSGSFFGEVSMIDGKTTPASVIATEDSLIALISKNDFLSIVFSQTKVTKKMMEILCSRLRKSWDTIQLLNFNNASQRTKMLFLTLIDEYGVKSPEGITLNIKLTHQDISDMTGLTRETVTRVIDKLQKSKEITILKSKFVQLNPSFLQDDVSIDL